MRYTGDVTKTVMGVGVRVGNEEWELKNGNCRMGNRELNFFQRLLSHFLETFCIKLKGICR